MKTNLLKDMPKPGVFSIFNPVLAFFKLMGFVYYLLIGFVLYSCVDILDVVEEGMKPGLADYIEDMHWIQRYIYYVCAWLKIAHKNLLVVREAYFLWRLS